MKEDHYRYQLATTTLTTYKAPTICAYAMRRTIDRVTL